MGPSDSEIEVRLAELRRRREVIDREIADHLLYLELGRRLSRAEDVPALAAAPPPPGARVSVAQPSAQAVPYAREQPGEDLEAPGDGIPPAVAFAQDPAAARRYGRALVAAACAVIRAAGRPLHAGEILPHLVARGFTLPGRDPVAALNTRLWKRAAPGGPLRRLGDATYAVAEDAEPDIA